MPIGKSWMPMGGGKAMYRPPSVTSRTTRSGGRAILGKGCGAVAARAGWIVISPDLELVKRDSIISLEKCATSSRTVADKNCQL
jgi:hypothetical protein